MYESERIVSHDHRHGDTSDHYGQSASPDSAAEIALILSRQLSVYMAASQAALAEKLGISLTELKALDLVQEFDALPTGQLGQLLGISWGGATALINRLEAAGYVQRGRHPLDRRVIVIRPVAERLRELDRARKAATEEVQFLSRQYDAQQLHIVQAFLAQYARTLRHDTVMWLQSRHGGVQEDSL